VPNRNQAGLGVEGPTEKVVWRCVCMGKLNIVNGDRGVLGYGIWVSVMQFFCEGIVEIARVSRKDVGIVVILYSPYAYVVIRIRVEALTCIRPFVRSDRSSRGYVQTSPCHSRSHLRRPSM
jgi:hypothetical protein